MENWEAKLAAARRLADEQLELALPAVALKEGRLTEAMRYATLGAGKAFRPFLVLTVAEMVGLAKRSALRIATALELIHCYSLIHDDLPAMDDDTLRRGKPTTHIRFDEATAILAGDALQAAAFEVLADTQTLADAETRCLLVRELARAAGAAGMAGGQMLDLIGEETPLSLTEIEHMQVLKTGALFRFACVAPALAAQAPRQQIQALEKYAHALGLAFQIADDILDTQGKPEEVGKTLKKDTAAHKSTFVSLLGADRARLMGEDLVKQASEALGVFGEKAENLREAVGFALKRKK